MNFCPAPRRKRRGRDAAERNTKMAKAKVLKIPTRSDWEFAEVETEADGNIPLGTMQSMVGGWLERWELHGHGLDGLDLFLDEEGKLKGLSYNPKATILAKILFHNDCIVGDTFVCAHDGEGRYVGLTEEQEIALRRRLNDIGV